MAIISNSGNMNFTCSEFDGEEDLISNDSAWSECFGGEVSGYRITRTDVGLQRVGCFGEMGLW